MNSKIILCLLTILTVAELRSPQVHEVVDEAPNNDQLTTTQKFNFESIRQTDRQKWRYLQQQAIDARHQARNAVVKNRPKTPKKRDVNNLEQNRLFPKTVNHALDLFDNSKNLKESSNSQLKLLNSLIGQTADIQLQGLHKLLNAKDYTPIIEDVIDVANPVNHPNIKVEPAPPELQEAVANVLVLQADTQRQIKEHNQLALAEIEKQINVPIQLPLSNEHQLQHVNLEEHQLKVHPAYGKFVGIQRKPGLSVYTNNKDNVSVFKNLKPTRRKRESDCKEDDWYLDYDFDNFTSDNLNSSLSDDYEYFYEIYNDDNSKENSTETVDANRRYYKVVDVPTFINNRKRVPEHDSNPQSYIVINNNNGFKDHEDKHKTYRKFPKRKRKKIRKRKHSKRRKQKMTAKKLKHILSKLDRLHL